MAEAQVVDIASDPLDQRYRLRRRLLRVGLPIAGVLLVVATLLAIAVHSYHANRRGALALSDDLLEALGSRVAQEVGAWLDPAARATIIARDLLLGVPLPDAPQAVERYAAALLRQLPQIALFSAADLHGNYMFVRRRPEGGLEIKRIRQEPGPRRVTVEQRNAEGDHTSIIESPDDTFDPRTRPWYRGALEADGRLAWTEIYVFFTERTPGLTASVLVPGPDRSPVGVIGLDISLEALSAFLARIEVGRRGRAMIVDTAGRLVAYPDAARVTRPAADRTLTTVRLDELGDPLLARAFDHLRLEGRVPHLIEVEGRRHVVAARPLPHTAGRGWSVLLTVPEDDFIGFVAANNRDALGLSVVVVLLAAMLALLLAWQGLRADHAARQLLTRARAITVQSRAFAALATSAELFNPSAGATSRRMTEELASVTGARRASVWRLLPDGHTLRCDDAFDHETNGHTTDMALHCDELPHFFERLARGETIAVVDAAEEPATAELHRIWLHPLGSRALLAAPVMREGRMAGAVWVEDASLDAVGAAEFLRAVANMLALRLPPLNDAAAVASSSATGAAATVPARAAAPPAVHAHPPRPDISRRPLLAELQHLQIARTELGAEVFAEIAVMAVRFTDPLALARRSPEGGEGTAARPLLDRLACRLQESAEALGIGYLALLGDQLVAAAGFAAAEAGPAAARCVAALAVETRDHCATLMETEGVGRRLEFRIGLDLGVAIGSPVGRAPERAFNLWGDAVCTADLMAASALPGSIQATEAAYDALREAFLFRPRGSFYLPRAGEMRTYILAGAL